LLPKGGAPWFHAAREAIIIAGKTGKTSQIVEIVATCHDDSADPLAESERRMALGWAVFLMLVNGEHDRASLILAELLKATRKEPADPRFDAVLLRCLGFSASLRGHHAEAVKLFTASSAASEKAGDLPSACAEKASVGFQLIGLGAYDSAEQILNDAL